MENNSIEKRPKLPTKMCPVCPKEAFLPGERNGKKNWEAVKYDPNAAWQCEEIKT